MHVGLGWKRRDIPSVARGYVASQPTRFLAQDAWIWFGLAAPAVTTHGVAMGLEVGEDGAQP